MSLVYRNENPLFVHSAKNILDINRIDSFLKNEHGSTMGPEFGATNLLELWVSDSKEYRKALSLIKNDMENQTVKASWICRECKEENEGNFELCWSCQSNRGRL